MANLQTDVYTIPSKFRKLENLHIVFWLLKDLSWCICFKSLAIAMIFPTMSIAIVITWQNRKNAAELYHNLAVLCWITANSSWMMSEFFLFDQKIIFGNLLGKYIAIFPFALGLFFLIYYYTKTYIFNKQFKFFRK